MAYIRTISPAEATGKVKEFYDEDIRLSGSVDNITQALSLHPEVYEAALGLFRAIKSSMAPRRYELVTVVAASCLRCTYCTLAHGAVLRSKFFGPEQVEAIVTDYHNASLEPAEVAMLAFVEKMTLNAYKVTQRDVDALREHGFSDVEILDIASAAAARSFYSKLSDAVGAEPDDEYLRLEPGLRQALTVGRPFGQADEGSK